MTRKAAAHRANGPAVQQLRRSAQFLTSVLESGFSVLLTLTADATVTYASPTVGPQLGYEPSEIKGKHALDCVHPDDRSRVALHLAALVQDPLATQRLELRVKHKDGSWHLLEAAATNVLDDPFNPCLVADLHDITETQASQDALHQAEHNFEVLFESMIDGALVIHASDMRILSANKAAAAILGFESPAGLSGANAFDFIHPEDASRVLTAIKLESIEDDGRHVPDCRLISGSREERHVHCVALPMQQRDAAAALLLFRDATDTRLADQALQRSERYYRCLTENCQDAIVVVNPDGTVRYQSPSLKRMLDQSYDTAIGTPYVRLIHRDDVQAATDAFTALIATPGATTTTEVRALHQNGSWRTMEAISHNLLHDPVISGIVVNFRDITERKRADRRLGQYQQHLEDMINQSTAELTTANQRLRDQIAERATAEQKLEKLYNRERRLRQQLEEEMNRRIEFTRALAHELKSPLTPVLMSSQLLASRLTDPTLLKLANNVARGASNLNSRIDELLDLAKGDIGMLHLKPEQVDVLQLLREIIEDVASVPASHNQSFDSKLPPSLPPVQADGTRLRQIVVNLLNNAFKYTPERGKITLSAGHDDSNLIIEIHDTGPGISRQEQQRLFEPYHRVETDRERLSGLGLGLALSKTLVELHGGRIWVESSTTRGSTFAFSLPFQQPTTLDETP